MEHKPENDHDLQRGDHVRYKDTGKKGLKFFKIVSLEKVGDTDQCTVRPLGTRIHNNNGKIAFIPHDTINVRREELVHIT